MENVNVVIVDDNPMILNTLDEVISSEAGLSVIGRADNGKDAIDMIKDTQPDVVLLDLVMPQMDGITVVENIYVKEPGVYHLKCSRRRADDRRGISGGCQLFSYEAV